jgi:hypothetical protein
MLKEQKRYEFRQELLQIHKKDVVDERLVANNDEFVFTDGMFISIPKDCSDVVRIAVEDFIDFLMVSMNVAVCVTKKQMDCQIQAKIGKNLGNADGYMGFRITTTKNSISIDGYDERGIAQAFYYLEDLMNVRKAPFLAFGKVERKAMFSPRMTQSPFGMYEYPDEAFAWIAHNGYDELNFGCKTRTRTTAGVISTCG